MSHRASHAPHGIVPPHVLTSIAQRGDAEHRAAARETLLATERLRSARALAAARAAAAAPGAGKRRTVFDAGHGERLPGKVARTEAGTASPDRAVNEAFDGLGATYDFFAEVLHRASIDGRGEPLEASVHFGRRYDNAFWNGREMVFGDGDDRLFHGFTACLEVVGHELSHGVIDAEAALAYRDQPGALNESFADVLGVLVKQWRLRQRAAEATWLVGEGLLAPGVHGVALRSMKAPGTAYDDRVLGRDPQPAHMRDYAHLADDGGGVHVNSGIPNHAFYLAATAFGGFAWEKAGPIWYDALCQGLDARSDFTAAASATAAAARRLHGPTAASIVRDAWRQVGVTTGAAESGLRAS